MLTLPLIAAERGWSVTFAMGGFSAALLTGGSCRPTVGTLIDRHGGHRVMPSARSPARSAWLGWCCRASRGLSRRWMLLGAAIAASLYDPAFASLGRIFGSAARVPITPLTLVGGFASTVSWPATYPLI